MTHCKPTRARQALVVTLCLSAFAAGCGSPAGTESAADQPAASTASPASAPQATRYDGETLFRGLYLGMGPVAARVPELTDARTSMSTSGITKEDIAKYLEGSAQRMRAADDESTAQRFESAAADLRSGDLTPEQMIEARRNYQSKSADAIVARISAADPAFFDTFAGEIQSGDQVRVQRAFEDGAKRFVDAASVAGALPGHVVPETQCLVALVAVYWVAVYYEEYLWDMSRHPQGALHRDELVQTLTSRLAAE